MSEQQSKFEGWAIVEVMGHNTFQGFVTTESFGGTVLFRVDVPEIPEQITEAGKREAVPAFTKLIGAGSIYCITPCTEETAKAARLSGVYRPLIQLDVVKGALPPVHDPFAFDDDGDDSNEEDGEF